MADQASQGIFSPALRLARITKARPWLRGDTLDVGCGSGALASFAEENRYFGYDYDIQSIELARQSYPKHQFGTALPEGRRFDTVVALALLEHLKNAADHLNEWRSLLAPGGRIVLTTPHKAFRRIHDVGAAIRMFSPDAADEHEEMFDRASLTALGKTCGMRLCHYERFLLWANQLAVFEPVSD